MIIHKKLNIIQNNPETLLARLNENKKLFKHIDMRVFDITRTESVIECSEIIEKLNVDDIVLYAESVFS